MIGILSKEEVLRKLLHILALALPVGIFYCPIIWDFNRLYVVFLILSFLLLFLIIEISRLKSIFLGKWFSYFFGSMMREEEKIKITGATYILGGSLICSFVSLYSDFAAAASFISLSLFILGDAAAAISGKAFGRIKVGKKTLEGAVGCLILCVSVSVFVFPQLPKFSSLWGNEISILEILVISFSVTILELFPIRVGHVSINDNLYVPVASTFIAFLVHYL